MEIIYSYLKKFLKDLKEEQNKNFSFIPFLLFLVTIPLSLGVNNICLIFFLISIVWDFKRKKFQFEKRLLYPVILFLLMCFSYLWSIDKEKTFGAIPKGIYLLILPILFQFVSFNKKQIQKIFSSYSWSITIVSFFFLIRALIRFLLTNDRKVFFYHGENSLDLGLVPKLLNAVHVSVFVSIAFFYFFTKENKTKQQSIISFFLFSFILLLSSKNIILIDTILILIYLFFYSKMANKMRLRNVLIIISILGIIFSFGKIKERFELEFQNNKGKASISTNVIHDIPQGTNIISIKEAWYNETFTPNDFFPGTAFRVYQLRLFLEFLKEENIFWNGFGLNASYKKIEEKGKKYNVFLGNENFEGYQKKNFHNQFVQIFSELGILGFLILFFMLFSSLKIAYKRKDFFHLSFTFIMISVFLTESFLWRQRGVVFFTVFYCLFNSKYILTVKGIDKKLIN